MATDWNRIGLALQGFGAGVHGQGAQFNQMLDSRKLAEEARNAQLSNERRQAAALDFFGTRQLLDQGRTDAALAKLNNREADITGLGGESVSTGYIRDLIAAGEVDEAKAFLDMALQQAEAGGYIQLPKPAERKTAVVDGALVDTQTGQPIYQSPQKPQERKTAQDSQGILRYLDTGEQAFPGDTGKQSTPEQQMLQQLELENAALRNQQLSQGIDQSAAKAEAETQTRGRMQEIRNSELTRAYSLVSNLLSPDRQNSIKAAAGPIDAMMPTFFGKTADVEADLSELQNLLTLDNLDRMTGVLSESDIKLLANAASGIDLKASQDRMVSKLREIQGRLASAFENSGLQAPSAASPETPQAPQRLRFNPQTGRLE